MQAYDEHGVTQTVDFCYGEVEEIPINTDLDAILEMNRRVWQWVYQPPNKDLDGFMCRCIIACWIFCPPLREYTQTDIAARFGKKKQSLNRWIVAFKRELPEVGQHLQHTKI
jgi:hypothetical protein